MSHRLAFVVPGPPRSKQRTRTKGRQFFTDAETRAHEKHVAQRAMLAARIGGWERTAAYVAVSITLHYPDKRRRDIDRAANSVLDGITQSGAVWDDDSQVDDLRVQRFRGASEPHTEVEIEVLRDTKGAA